MKSRDRMVTRMPTLSRLGETMLSYSAFNMILESSPRTWLSISPRNFLNCDTHPRSSFLVDWLSPSANTINTSISNPIIQFSVSQSILAFLFRNIPDQSLNQFVMVRHHKVKVQEVNFKEYRAFSGHD